ncbi:MAG: c-type cytochrome [Gemmatimonadaceae bacterium]
MKQSLLISVVLVALSQSATAQTPAATPAPTPEQIAARNDSLRADRASHVNRLLEQIKGKEDLPAEEVFQDIRILKGMPARRLLNIMSMGYSNALGVSCSHCHVTTDFSAEDKVTKQVARDMVAMAAIINDSLLKNIKNIRSENPGVSCSTCHNSQPRPGFGPRARPQPAPPAG